MGDTYTMVHCQKCCVMGNAKRDRRERIATAVLAGFAYRGMDRDEAIIHALRWADTLIAALDAEGGDGVA